MGALHVTNGASAEERIRSLGLSGPVVTWDDVLHEGPVRALVPGAFRAERAAYLAAQGWGGQAAVLASLEARDAALQAGLVAGEELVLWFEDDLYDMLQLLQVLTRVDAHRGPVRWSLVLVSETPFRGVGELPLEELAPAFAARTAPPGAPAYAARAWSAFTAGDLRALDALSRAPAPLAPVPAALRRLLEELPDADDGLARSERSLLRVLADGPRTGMAAFVAAARDEERPFFGDTTTFARLAALVAGGLATGGATYALTDAGRAVLAGEARAPERVRWLGGREVGDRAGPHWSRAAGRLVAAS